jgi:hypothetical protein
MLCTALNFRHASGDHERTRRAIQAFLVLRSLQYKMLKLQDRFPINLAEDNIKREQEFEISMSSHPPHVH